MSPRLALADRAPRPRHPHPRAAPAAVCLFLGVATLAAIGSLTRGITSELEVRADHFGGDIEFGIPQREATAEEMAAFRRAGETSSTCACARC